MGGWKKGVPRCKGKVSHTHDPRDAKTGGWKKTDVDLVGKRGNAEYEGGKGRLNNSYISTCRPCHSQKDLYSLHEAEGCGERRL